MPTDTDEIKLPTQPGSPTSEHGQMMFAMGQMVAQIKGLKEAQITANGRTSKLEGRIELVEKWQTTSDGQDKGISKTWALLYAIVGLLVGALGVYFAIHQ